MSSMHLNQPRICVIVRSMDRPTLAEALQSIASQDQPNIHIVVVNAKGGHHSSCEQLAQPCTLQIINQGGHALSRAGAANAGLAAAQADYLAFLDDDDTLDPNHISHLLDVLQSNPQPAVAFAGVRCMARDDPQHQISRVFGQHLESPAQLLAGNFIPIHAPLYPSSLLAVAKFDESLDTYEDWDFWLQLVQHAPFIYSRQITATYYTGGTSGVSPQSPDWEAVRRASQALLSKWMRITPDDFRNICNLYHGAVAERTICQLELANTKAKLEQVTLQNQSLTQQLNQIYQCHSWRLTQPLRQFKTWVSQSLNR